LHLCYFILNVRPDFVRLGDLNLDPNVDDKSQPIDVNIFNYIIHENSISNNKIDDVALLELEREVDVTTTFIRPACLLQNFDITESSTMSVVS
jgi:Trypsin